MDDKKPVYRVGDGFQDADGNWVTEDGAPTDAPDEDVEEEDETDDDGQPTGRKTKVARKRGKK